MVTHTDVAGPALQVFESSLVYTCAALATVEPTMLTRRTPCRDWSLGDLLCHMEDGLDAFASAASGVVAVDPAPPAVEPGVEWQIRRIQAKASDLRQAWLGERSAYVALADTELDSTLFVYAASLEITGHGWDVAQSTGARTPIPGHLSDRLVPVAHHLIGIADRGVRFAAPSGAADPLLAELGRRPMVDTTPGPDQRTAVR